MKYISFVVDAIDLHYYQAQLLLHSLVKNTHFTKEQIIVQCVKGVHHSFLGYLHKNGYTYTIIAPYLDGKYCNKLAQLSFFRDKDVESVILLDADTYVLDNALYELNASVVMGKTVDAPNPPMETIEHIFQEASLSLLPTIQTDWDLPKNITIEGNFNGGFYYIPGDHIKTIDTFWKKWASWLFERAYLFKNRAHAIHTDQLSFAMALADSHTPYTCIESNYNFPLHTPNIPSGLNQKSPLHLLHYHRELNAFGFIGNDHLTSPMVTHAVEFANRQISTLDSISFFHQYKKSSRTRKPVHATSITFDEQCRSLAQQYGHIALYLHAGTPKTATTSFQHLCAEHTDVLKSKKLLYPSNYTQHDVPKHQWLVSVLLQDSEELMLQKINEVLHEAVMEGCDTVVLSTEGIYNHWWDLSEHAKSMLSILIKHLQFNLILVLREPTAFMYSFYQQNLKNPKMDHVQCYGQNWSFSQMLLDPWFLKHLDYLDFIYDWESMVSSNRIHIIPYSKDVIANIFKLLDIEISRIQHNIERKNTGLTSLSIKILMLINESDISAEDKKHVLNSLFACNDTLKKYSDAEKPLEKKKITHLMTLQQKILEKYYNISFIQ